ncbi:hypothetical protein N7466_000649 [Penicillium verhagenii]|uniref:uncharacterized protein n=1 Tax=Penicillium verhagenii TaxID=1562060 RepID=UPI002544E902|nr:uncharacterized protein N7466_000649 [Penicillium verhagenii]KAJ5947634.1 hypothetical protein N7466_000649 [Penicillium verhagenii]
MPSPPSDQCFEYVAYYIWLISPTRSSTEITLPILLHDLLHDLPNPHLDLPTLHRDLPILHRDLPTLHLHPNLRQDVYHRLHLLLQWLPLVPRP